MKTQKFKTSSGMQNRNYKLNGIATFMKSSQTKLIRNEGLLQVNSEFITPKKNSRKQDLCLFLSVTSFKQHNLKFHYYSYRKSFNISKNKHK